MIDIFFILFSIAYYCADQKLSQPDHKQLSFLFARTYCTITLSVIIAGEIFSDRAENC